MNVETIVNDVKGAVDPYVTKGQGVISVSVDAVKQVNTVVVDSVQELYKTNLTAGKGLFEAAQSSFEKARAAGVKQVASEPVSYLPEGKDLVLGAYKDSYAILSRTGEELVSVVRKGYDEVFSTVKGKKTVSAAAKKTKKTVRKTAKKAKTAAKKATAV